MSSLTEGDVIHGIASCGNSYRIMSFGTHPKHGDVVLLRIEKIDVVPFAAMEKDYKTGQMLVRVIASLEAVHRARDCPYA
jgi:hypothetical protein